MSRRKRIVITAVTALFLALVLFVPLPASWDPQAEEHAVAHALKALIQNRRVLTDRGYIRLYDWQYVNDNGRLYFENDLGIPDAVFLQHGLKPIPTDRELDVDSGDVIISFSHWDIQGNKTENVQFAYVYGSLAAQGFEIRTYRSLLVRYFLYVHQWVS